MSKVFTEYSKEFDRQVAAIESMQNSYVLIGFQEGSTTHSQVKNNRKKEGGLSMAQIAAENEFGTRTIPARPFLVPAFDENRDMVNNAILGEYNKILNGESTVKQSLKLLGVLGVSLVQKKIRSIYFPQNSFRTIQEKGSSKPLIDFGQMIQSVKSKVVINK